MGESWHIPRALSDEALRLLTDLPMEEIERRLRMDGPTVPEGREPAAVEGQPSDEELIQQAIKIGLAFQPHPHVAEVYLPFDGSENPIDNDLIAFARAVLARWGSQQPLRPIPVSERPPGPEDCDLLGCCWWGDAGGGEFVPSWRLCERPDDTHFDHWLPANALPLPEESHD